MWANHMNGFGWGGGMGLYSIVFVVAIVAVVWWLVRNSQSRAPGASNRPLDILKERYARGEIDKDEYESKRRDLEQ